MSLDVHPDYPHLIAAGFYDGTVGVYNTAENTQKPKYMSNAKNGKHTDPVWQVCLNFKKILKKRFKSFHLLGTLAKR
jgi:hypothetical protein